MARTNICIPCMDMMHQKFVQSLLAMRKEPDTNIMFGVSSLIYDARNVLAENTVRGKYDRILWLDSDMVFDRDLMEKLSARLDEGYDMVSALYVSRKPPIRPCVYSHVQPGENAPSIEDYDGAGLVQIEGCGFGAVMMTVDLVNAVGEAYGRPFSPIIGLGEDLSFCYRVTALGRKMFCDTDIRVGHCGQMVYKP